MKKILNSLKTRSFRVGGYSVVATAFVLAIAVLVNVAAGALPQSWTRIDTTRNDLFSVSDQTRVVLDNVTQQVDMYWIVQSGAEDSSLEGLLENYRSLSKNIRVKKVDPDQQPTFAQQYGITELYNNSVVVQSGEQYRFVSYYDIYTYDYTNYYYDGTYDVSFTGENALTSAIDFVVDPDVPKMYILTGHGEVTMGSTFSKGLQTDNVVTEALTLASAGAVPADADGVIIASPARDITEEELASLRDYLAGGGTLFLTTGELEDKAPLTNLEALMADYGLIRNDGIVVEGDTGYMMRGTPVNLLPALQSHEITDPLRNGGYYVYMPITQGITVGETPDGVTVTQLMTTSDTAYSKVAGYAMETYTKEDGDIDGPFALAVAVSDENTGGRVVWAATENLLNDSASSGVSGGNLDLFLNAVRWLCGSEGNDMVIRAKELTTEYLTIDSGVATLLTVVMVGVVPLAYLAIGLVIWIRRRRR